MKAIITSTLTAAGLLLCMLLTGCTDEILVQEETIEETGQPFTLTASQAAPATRLALGEDGLSTYWEKGDQLALVEKSCNKAPIYLTCTLEEETATRATFTTRAGVPAGDYYVLYNYNKNLTYGHQRLSTIDEINSNDKLALWGELTVKKGDSSAIISLQHIYAKLRVFLKNLPEGENCYRIGMYAAGKGFPIYRKLTSNGLEDYSGSTTAPKMRFHNICLTNSWTNGSQSSEDTQVLIETGSALILPEDISNAPLFFYITIGNTTCYEIKKENIKFEAGKSYKVTLDMTASTTTVIRLTNTEETLPGYSYPTTVYNISTPEECRFVAYNNDNALANYKITQDIDFTNQTFLPFYAKYVLGNNKTLKNISLDWPEEDNVGLIRREKVPDSGLVYPNDNMHGAHISDLTLENISLKGNSYVGALGGSNIRAVKCKVIGYSSIIGNGDYVGGFVGYIPPGSALYAPITSFSECEITETCTIKGKNRVGGLIGIYGYNSIIGDADTEIALNKCTSAATVTGTGDYVGGIFGKFGNDEGASVSSIQTLSITECVNKGKVSGKNYVGGISGSFTAYSSNEDTAENVLIELSYNEGDVEGDSYVGGIVGNLLGSVKTSYSTGYIKATTTAVGGIAGEASGSPGNPRIKNCYSLANLTVGTDGYAGGILGYSNTSDEGKSHISNCYFAGTNTNGYGIMGYSKGYSNIANCITTLSSLGYQGENDTVDEASKAGVTSIKENLSIINGDNAYSDLVWEGYDYECVKFATDTNVGTDAPNMGDEEIEL